MLKTTIDMIREIRRTSNLKSSRYIGDVLHDRIIQACTEQTLTAVIENLCKSMQSSGGSADVYGPFLKASGSDEANSVLAWIRKYPKIAAMLAMANKDDYPDLVESMSIGEMSGNDGCAKPDAPHDINLTVHALSPIAHGSDSKAGNATLFRRMQVLTDTGSVVALPFYAGNAMRGQMRDLLADDLLKLIGLTPRRDQPPVELWFFHALYAGGALEENSASQKAMKKMLGDNGAIRSDGIYEFRDTLPSLSLLGCALGNRVLPGRSKFGDLRPCCKQWSNGDIDVAQLFEWTFLTRREDHEAHEADHNSSMIANTECLRAGATLKGGIDFDRHVSDIERAALHRGIKLMQEQGAIGAENRRGLGNVSIEIDIEIDDSKYLSHISENKNKIVKYLESLGALNAQRDLTGELID